MVGIFATLRKSTSKERLRKLFGDKKSNSIETSDLGHTIGAIGKQVLKTSGDVFPVITVYLCTC